MPANSSATNTALDRLSYDFMNQTGQFAPDVVAANRARMDAATKAREDRLAAGRAAGKAAQAAENERLSLLQIPSAAEYWDDTQASLGWENPYPKRPGTVPGVYERFDYTVPGSGIAGGGNYALAFDRAFSSQWKSPIAGLSDAQQHLYGGDTFPFLSAEQVRKLAGNVPQQAYDAAKFNQTLEDQKTLHRTYTTNKEYLQAFQTLGIDPKSLTTPEALAAISPDAKAAVYDLVQRQLQFKNQRAKPFGFGDALGIGLTAASVLVPGLNAWQAGALAAGGAAAGGGDLGDIALAGGLAGLGNWAGGKFDTWAKGVKAANAAKAAAAGVPVATGIKSLGTAAGWGNVGRNVAGQLIQPTIYAVGQELFAESPPAPQDDSSSDSRGGILSGVINRITQGVGSLPQTTSSFVDPTPYLGRGALNPAFMNQSELGNVASPSGMTALNPAFMNQFELGNAASPSGVTSLNPAFMNQFERTELGLA